MISLKVNKKPYEVDADPNMPLLWVIRDIIGLTGTKFGCGVAQCGACVIHLNGEAVRSCVTKLSRAEHQEIGRHGQGDVNYGCCWQMGRSRNGVPC